MKECRQTLKNNLLMKTLTLFIGLFLIQTVNAQYETQQSGTSEHLTDVDFIDENNGFVGGYAGVLRKTTDGGTNWTTISSPTNQIITSISMVNENIVFITSGDSFGNRHLYKTTDGGNTFQEISFPFSIEAMSVEFLNAQTGYLSTGFDGIYKSINGGQTWYAVTNSTSLETQFVSPQVGYAYNINSVFKSSDAGETWSMIMNSGMFNLGNVQFHAFFFSSEDNGHIASAYDGQLITTDDDCQTITVNTFDWSIMDVYFTSDLVGYATHFANPGNYILKTTDGGLNWTQIHTETVTLSGQHYIHENLGWIVGSFGKILKYNPNAALSNATKSPNVSIYPNPANDILKISAGDATINSLAIYTTSGVEVLSVDSFNGALSIAHLASGAYFVTVETSEGLLTQKLIKE